jgi:flagellar biosynthesis GTPase FlhF
VDFHELIAREERRSYAQADADEEAVLPEYASAPEFASSRRSARARERRAVAPGSQTRARAGVEKGLRRVGVSAQLAGELIDGAAAHVLPLAPRAGLAQAVRTTIAQRIPVAPPLPTRGAAIVVVGAGGTGKTTCCAALLAAYRAGSTLPASFATLTRGAQRDDLRLILAPRIVKPMAAGTPRALGALRRAKDDGLAVVDTPRMSPADKAGIRTLAHLLGDLEPERIVVALPATLGAQAAAQLLTALRPLGANAMAVTHADETDQIGVAVEAACAFGLAPEYLLDCSPSGAWRLRGVDPVELAGRLLP